MYHDGSPINCVKLARGHWKDCASAYWLPVDLIPDQSLVERKTIESLMLSRFFLQLTLSYGYMRQRLG